MFSGKLLPARAAILVVAALASVTAGCGKSASSSSQDAHTDSPVVSQPDGRAEATAGTDGGGDARSDVLSDGGSDAASGDGAAPPQTLALTVTAVDTTFNTRDHFIAAVEMQLSGEPFAEAMGRDLGGYTRAFACRGRLLRPHLRPIRATAPSEVDIARLFVGRRVVRILEAADEQHRVRVGRGHLAAVRAGAEPDGRDRARTRWRIAQTLVRAHGRSSSNAVSRFVKAPIGRQPARVAGAVADAAAVRVVESGHRADERRPAACCSAPTTTPAITAALVADDYECDCTTLHLPDRAAQVIDDDRPGRVRLDATGRRRCGR